jgi:hypothetical protein
MTRTHTPHTPTHTHMAGPGLQDLDTLTRPSNGAEMGDQEQADRG